MGREGRLEENAGAAAGAGVPIVKADGSEAAAGDQRRGGRGLLRVVGGRGGGEGAH